MTTVDGAVSAREAARMTGVVERTVRRWIEKGRLPAERNADGQFRIQVAALKPFMRDELEPPATTESAANGIVDQDEPVAMCPHGFTLDRCHRGPTGHFWDMPSDGWMERAIRAELLLELICQAYGDGDGGQPTVYGAVQLALGVFWRHSGGAEHAAS